MNEHDSGSNSMDNSFDNRPDLFTANFYRGIDPIELAEKIRRFRKLDLKSITDAELSNEIYNVLCNGGMFYYPTSVRVLPTQTVFYRVRALAGCDIPISNFHKLSDLWEPPAECVKSRGRLNKANEALLYLSLSDPHVAIKETNIQDGQYYALIKYISCSPVKVNVIGGEYNRELLGLSDDRAWLSFSLINDFLRDEYSRYVGKGTEFLYRVSEMIAKEYFDLPPREAQDAWGYCSIHDKSKYNVCFRPEIAHDVLSLNGAMICRKDSSDENKVFYVALPSGSFEELQYKKLGSPEQKRLFPEIIYNPR